MRRVVLPVALAVVLAACAGRPPAAPPAQTPKEDKAYAGCVMNRRIDLWLTTPEHGEPPWAAPKSAVEVRDAYCVVEQNRVLDPGVECLDVRDCDDLAGHEVRTISCTRTPSDRYSQFVAQAWDKEVAAVATANEEWRTRLGQCYRVTWGGASAPELAAFEHAFASIEGDIAYRGEGALLELWPPVRDAAYQRVFFSFAREVTQLRGGVKAKAIVSTHHFSIIARAGKLAEAPFIHTDVGVPFGFEGHYTTTANAAVDVAYCAGLRKPGIERGAPLYAGDDEVVVRAAQRNDAVLACARGDDRARDALVRMDDELVGRDAKNHLAKGWSLRDPCAP